MQGRSRSSACHPIDMEQASAPAGPADACAISNDEPEAEPSPWQQGHLPPKREAEIEAVCRSLFDLASLLCATTLTGGRLTEHERHIRMVLEAIRQLMDHHDAVEPPSPIGFQVQDEDKT